MAANSNPWANMTWLNPPPDWRVTGQAELVAVSGDKTDFWQRTFYGFQRDDGHALLARTNGDFSAQVTVQANFTELYDQCGLMLRVSKERWVKFGVEFTDGETHLSCVATDGTSDWSAAPLAINGPLSLRATKLGDAVLCQYRPVEQDDAVWRMARLLPFDKQGDVLMAGPYLCSPERAGFEVKFWGFQLTEPQQTQLHA
ncbi:MAG: DUF1349 domain-containing protein [Pseudomonadota bacterium]